MATAHHRQNESYPLQLKIRSHETPATTDLSEPLIKPLTVQVQSLILATPSCCPTGSVWKTTIHYYAAMLITSITQLRAKLSHSPWGLHHPMELTLLQSYTLQPKVTPTKNTAVVGEINPIWKILVKWDHSPPGFRVKIKNNWNHHLGLYDSLLAHHFSPPLRHLNKWTLDLPPRMPVSTRILTCLLENPKLNHWHPG